MFKCSVIGFIVLFCFYFIDVSSKEIDDPVSVRCINCLCQAASACSTKDYCKNDVCGSFRIPKSYWIETDQPTINRMPPDHPKTFSTCANDFYCSYFILQRYMKKHQKDCNGDGKIDCDDYVAILNLGPDACNGTLPESYKDRYDYCQAYY